MKIELSPEYESIVMELEGIAFLVYCLGIAIEENCYNDACKGAKVLDRMIKGNIKKLKVIGHIDEDH